MNTLTKQLPVTSAVTNVTNVTQSSRPATRLASAYHYRRNGIYYLRLRETGSTTQAASVSLKTTDRREAMGTSRRLAESIKAFHLDNPTATWHELRERLLLIAEGLLPVAHDVNQWGGLHEDATTNLTEVTVMMPIRNQPVSQYVQHDNSLSLSVSAPAITFEFLSGLYMSDRAGEQKASTLNTTKFTHGVLCTELGVLDLRMHTRAHLVALRDRLATTRKPSTVNQMLMKLSAVLNWSVENGHLEKSYDKKLKFTKGTESSRKAFTQEQVGKLMAYANNLPETSWKRWLLSLGIITGGRLNEISQLTTSDIQTLESGVTVIHINEVGEGKSIKNKRSERQVPLTDGAYGFDLAAFLRYVSTFTQSGSDSLAQIGYRPAGQWVNQQAIPQSLGESYVRGLVFHSLRHSLASLMQAKGVPITHAQAVMGHASGTITFDTYGEGVPVLVIAEMLRGLLTE